MLKELPIVPADADKTTSDACTRSGTFALALSIVLFALTAAWINRPSEYALRQYVSLRYDLVRYLEELDVNPKWADFRKLHNDAEIEPLSTLLVQVKTSQTPSQSVEEFKQRSLHPKTEHSKKLHSEVPVPPRPPTNLTIVELPNVLSIVDTVSALNNPELLNTSRKYSNFFNISIERWAERRHDLINRNAIHAACNVTTFTEASAGSVPLDDDKTLLACLTIDDVRDLAQFEHPIVVNPDQIGGHITRDIDISPGMIPRNLPLASSVVQGILFFVLVYFYAFAREAALSESILNVGTLFGAFSRSRFTVFALGVALWIPFFASLAMSIAAKRLWVGTVLIFFIVWAVGYLLLKKSYWKPLAWRKP